MGASASAIPHSLYKEIMHDIAPAEIEEIDVTIKLANRDTISPIGIVRDVEVLCGEVKYPADFLILGSPQDDFCPIIFGRPFLNTVNAKIDCEKDVVTIGLGDMSHEFNFAKSRRQPHDRELPSKDEIIGLASIVVPPTDPLEQYLLDHGNDMFMNERREIDEVFFKQGPILKHNFPVEILGILLHPRVISCLSLNHFLILLNMLILMKRRYILLLLVLTFQSRKRKGY
ncbi:unnamed protein product [Triticum aestivum]|uniref:Uncharacterized protein n=1 Tax=Triticum aestivum TaxID=4565 RepID=A0A7H4LDJ6_WHEAT|nr:unnamed protein product [Triticum aestivum]